MKKIYSILYIAWVVFSTILCVFLLIAYYPSYKNNEFPLFTDITLLVFLSSLFIFSHILIHLLAARLRNKLNLKYKQIIFIQSTPIFISFVILLSFMEFDLGLRIIISFISFVIAIPHFALTIVLYRKKNHHDPRLN